MPQVGDKTHVVDIVLLAERTLPPPEFSQSGVGASTLALLSSAERHKQQLQTPGFGASQGVGFWDSRTLASSSMNPSHTLYTPTETERATFALAKRRLRCRPFAHCQVNQALEVGEALPQRWSGLHLRHETDDDAYPHDAHS